MNNTIDCRAWHVQVAVNHSNNATLNQAHCGHASPQGGGYCGTGCENYCDNVQQACMGGLKQWSDPMQCLRACESWPNQTLVTWAATPISQGNSLPCRKYHASLAGVNATNAQMHCIHSGPLGGTICGTECDGLCQIAEEACPTQATNCASMCANNLTSSDSVETSKILSGSVPRGSVGCATYFALKALSDSSLCTKLSTALTAAPGDVCDGSASFVLKVSWTVIAVLFVALSFTS